MSKLPPSSLAPQPTARLSLVLLFLASLLTVEGSAQVVISEFVANNKSTLDDIDGDSSDWIEIHNQGTQINLGGYGLTDDPAQPRKWTIPSGHFIGPNAYLVVFASSKDRRTLGQQLHTNFSLDSGGDYLALSDPSGTIIQEFAPTYPSLKRDLAYGTGSNGNLGYLSPPTPNAPNGPQLSGFVADTLFSHQRGFYDQSFAVTISSATPGATIRYTLDGSEPTPTSGRFYVGPLSIRSSTVLRAMAYKTGLVPTNVDAKSYLFTADIINQPEMLPQVVTSATYRREIQPALKALPVVSLSFNDTLLFGGNGIHSRPNLSGRSSEREVHFEYFDPAEPTDSTHEPAGVRIHGGNSREHPKKNFRLYFRSDYGKSRLKHNLFPESPVDSFKHLLLRGGGHDAWTFRADWHNATLIRNEFLHRLQHEMGQPSPYGKMVSLFLNGDYWGVYELQELPHEEFNADHHGGQPDDWDVIKHGAEVESGDDAAWNSLIDLARAGISSDTDYAAIQEYIDIDNFADAMIHRIWCSDEDWLAPAYRNGQSIAVFTDDKNWYVARKSRNGAGKFFFYSWDAEMSMGIPFALNPLNDLPLPRSYQNDFTRVDNDNSPGIIYDALRRHPDFQLRFADRLHQHMFNNGALTPANLRALWDPLVDTVRSPIVGESARWGLESWTGSPRNTPYTRDSEWIPATNWIRTQFLINRTTTVLNQFRTRSLYPGTGAPHPSLVGTLFPVPVSLSLSTTTPGSTIYYSTDGRDPRTPSSISIVSFVGGDHPVQAIVPSALINTQIGTTWRNIADPVNIQNWMSGPNGVGYENSPFSSPNYTSLIKTELTNMHSQNPSAYIRYKFNIADQATLDTLNTLTLRIRYDDGFVAYLNGEQIESRNVSATNWNSAASSSHSDTQAVDYIPYDQTSDITHLQVGENVLAIHGFNRSSTSNDFLIQAQLQGGAGTPGGALDPNAIAYSGSIPLNETTLLHARTRRSDGSWSALTELLYQIGTPASFDNFKITEIHYHPTDPVTEAELALSASDNDFEFVELQNVSNSEIDLSLCRFHKGIDFQFPVATYLPAGERVLLVSNRAAFLARYGPTLASTIIGEFDLSTNLSNKGERLACDDARGRKIFSFPYDDDAPWPLSPDGTGPSLVLIDPLNTPESELDEGLRWRASLLDFGAPGLADEDSYELWTRKFFGPLDGANPALADPDAIPGPGGLTNFMLYAQGFDLGTRPAHELSIVGVTRLDESDYLTLTIQFRNDLHEPIIVAEVSDDLVNWSSTVVAVSAEDHGDGTSTLTVRDENPITQGQDRYIRVRISN